MVESSDEDNRNETLQPSIPINNVRNDSKDFEEIYNFLESSNSNVSIKKDFYCFNKLLIYL